MKVFTQFFMAIHVFFYKLTSGKIGGQMGPGRILLLDNVGRKTGKPRTTPVMFFRDGNNYVVTASAGGAPTNPGWYYNLRAVPTTTIQVMGQKISVSVEEAGPEKRDALWTQLVSKQPQFKGYESKTSRIIPMLILKPL